VTNETVALPNEVMALAKTGPYGYWRGTSQRDFRFAMQDGLGCAGVETTAADDPRKGKFQNFLKISIFEKLEKRGKRIKQEITYAHRTFRKRVEARGNCRG